MEYLAVVFARLVYLSNLIDCDSCSVDTFDSILKEVQDLTEDVFETFKSIILNKKLDLNVKSEDFDE